MHRRYTMYLQFYFRSHVIDTFNILTAAAGSCVKPSFAIILVPLPCRLSVNCSLICKGKMQQIKFTELVEAARRSTQDLVK